MKVIHYFLFSILILLSSCSLEILDPEVETVSDLEKKHEKAAKKRDSKKEKAPQKEYKAPTKDEQESAIAEEKRKAMRELFSKSQWKPKKKEQSKEEKEKETTSLQKYISSTTSSESHSSYSTSKNNETTEESEKEEPKDTEWLKGIKGAKVFEKGAGSFVFDKTKATQNRPIEVFYYRPKNLRKTSPVLISMHGVSRNGDKYRDVFIEAAEDNRWLLLAPQFTEEFYPSSHYQSGGVQDEKRKDWTYHIIEDLFDFARTSLKLKAEKYAIFGHSAGSQFVHRMTILYPEARYHTAIAANAGWYTLPDRTDEFPYGVSAIPKVSKKSLKKSFSKNLIILLGTADNDPNAKHLRRRPALDQRQGDNRYDRGLGFFAESQKIAKRMRAKFNWEVEEVPDVAHETRKMARAAAPILKKRLKKR